ncbi:hypothetical protein HKD37_02G006100 [Glycine soja]
MRSGEKPIERKREEEVSNGAKGNEIRLLGRVKELPRQATGEITLDVKLSQPPSSDVPVILSPTSNSYPYKE